MYIHKDADLDLAVDVAIASAFEDGGQRCTSLHNLILHEDVAEAFKERFLEAVDKMVIGNTYEYDRPTVTYGPMMNKRWGEGFKEHYIMAEQDEGRLGSS